MPRADVGAANLTWTAPSGGNPVTTYTVTPYIGSDRADPDDGDGLAAGDQRADPQPHRRHELHFKVTASNPNGAGPASDPSNAVTPTSGSLATAPLNLAAVPGSQSAQVSWAAPANNGGSPITGYTVTPYVGGTAQATTTVGGSALRATVTGLSNNTTYTFKVAANTASGPGRSPRPRVR